MWARKLLLPTLGLAVNLLNEAPTGRISQAVHAGEYRHHLAFCHHEAPACEEASQKGFVPPLVARLVFECPCQPLVAFAFYDFLPLRWPKQWSGNRLLKIVDAGKNPHIADQE